MIKEKQINYHKVLFELSRRDNSNFDKYVEHVLKTLSGALNINELTLWLCSNDNKHIQYIKTYSRQDNLFSIGTNPKLSYYPRYIKILNKELSGDNSANTYEPEKSDDDILPGSEYNNNLPVWLNGKIIGAIYIEDQGYIRHWDEEEQLFSDSIAELISAAYERSNSTKRNNELLENQRFLNTLITNLPGYVYRCQNENNKWITKFASEGIYELTGYESKDFLGKSDFSFGNLLLAGEQAEVAEAVQEAINNNKPYQITYRIKTKDDKIKWVWEQGRGIYNEANKLVATEGYIIDITEKKLAEDEIVKRNEELFILNQIGKSLSKLADKNEILSIIHIMIGKLYDVNNLYIALYNQKDNTISFPVYTIEGAIKKQTDRPFGNGVTEHVINTMKPLLIEKDAAVQLQLLGVDRLGKYAKSLLSVPMITGNNVLGVITIQNYNLENVFNEKDSELLFNIATQAAIALENARLYDEIQNELKEKEIAEETIRRSLHEKEVLLQEVHHRVKNNLQIMSSLLRLQSQNIRDEEILDMFRESETRVKSMAIVHNKLYKSKDYERIDFRDYIKSLTENLIGTYAQLCAEVNFYYDIDKIQLNIDTAIPCGLLLNELISNAIKYAFPERKGKIKISVKHKNEKFLLTVKDNGIGLPENYKELKPDSLGLKLVSLLTKQINGTLTVSGNKGAEFTIEFEEIIYKPRN